MIQLSFTKDLHTPVAIWFDEDDEIPQEYIWTHYYKYLTKKEVEQMLDDPHTTKSVKQALQDAMI